MKQKQLQNGPLLTALILTMLVTFAPVCYAADNLTNFNTVCNWAEIAFPNYFSPTGVETFKDSGFLIRHYQDTGTYIGTINGNFYVIGGAFGNEIICVGTIGQLLNIANIPEAIGFSKTFGNVGYNGGNSVQQTSGGGYIVVGYTYPFDKFKKAVHLIKTDVNGIETWAKTFGGETVINDDGNSVQQTADGGYIVTGHQIFTRTYVVTLFKTNSNGERLWFRSFDDYNWLSGEGNSVQQTTDGGYIIAGTVLVFGAKKFICLIKTDDRGDELWSKTFGTIRGDCTGKSVQQTADGGYILVGDTDAYGAGGKDVYLIKTNSSGNKTWTKTYGGTEYEFGNSVQQTADGGYILVGDTSSYGAGGYDVYLIKTNSSGNMTWARTFGGTKYELGNSVQQTADGGYILVGGTSSYGAGKDDVYLIKTNGFGIETWAKTFGGLDSDSGGSVQQTADGGYIIAGSTKSFGTGKQNIYLIKTDEYGNQKDK